MVQSFTGLESKEIEILAGASPPHPCVDGYVEVMKVLGLKEGADNSVVTKKAETTKVGSTVVRKENWTYGDEDGSLGNRGVIGRET